MAMDNSRFMRCVSSSPRCTRGLAGDVVQQALPASVAIHAVLTIDLVQGRLGPLFRTPD